jgi:spoIIIJ-associated protein
MSIQEYLRDLLDLLLLDNYEIEASEDERNLWLHISLREEDSGILIGYHGETLAAIQRLLRTVFADQVEAKRIVININDYRDQREDKIRELVERGVAKIRGSGRKYYLYRLNSAERYFAHSLINSDEYSQDYTSYSIDDAEDGSRVLVIEKKSA